MNARTAIAPLRRTGTQQLLIEMPAESAARLITRSLLEQLMQLAGTEGERAEFGDAWRRSADRLHACVSLYSDALAGSIPKKFHRYLRDIARESERLHRAGVQLAWMQQWVPTIPTSATDSNIDHGRAAVSAAWMGGRAQSKESASREALQRLQRDGGQLRRFAKNLGVYTTAVRLDDLPAPQSFAALTGALIRDESARLRKELARIRPTRLRSTVRALEASRRLSYLLEPVRVHLDGVATVAEQLRALQLSLGRLSDLAAIAKAIMQGGKKAAALHMSEYLSAEMLTGEVAEGDSSAPSSSKKLTDLRPGVVALARQVHVELAPALERFADEWGREELIALSVQLDACVDLMR